MQLGASRGAGQRELLQRAHGSAGRGGSQQMLQALKPAELELALAAVDELEQRDQDVMRQWQMRIERAEYECALAERRYEQVDPANRLVAASLERRWNAAMSHVEEIKAEAAKFQAQKTRVLSAEQRARILALARDLPRVWRAPSTEAKDRKRMLRLLIADITVEDLRASRQVVLHIRWHGGACSDVTVARRPPMADQLRYPNETVELVRKLASTLSNARIAQTLNAQRVRSSRGKPFTASMIQWIRYRYGIPATRLQRPDEITVKQLADELGVSIHFVHYWIKQGLINARQIIAHGSWWIAINDQQRRELRDRIRNSGHFKDRHCEAQL